MPAARLSSEGNVSVEELGAAGSARLPGGYGAIDSRWSGDHLAASGARSEHRELMSDRGSEPRGLGDLGGVLAGIEHQQSSDYQQSEPKRQGGQPAEPKPEPLIPLRHTASAAVPAKRSHIWVKHRSSAGPQHTTGHLRTG